MATDNEIPSEPKIVVRKNGPYRVYGDVPLVGKTQIVSEFGEPLTWKKGQAIDTEAHHREQWYSLCRCGQSHEKPFCDGTHKQVGFDGTETADTRPIAERQAAYDGDGTLAVKHDDTLCSESGFCGTRNVHLRELAKTAGEAGVAAQIIAMIEHCPSGSLTYAAKAGEAEIEPDLPQQIAVTTEITSEGPIAGPLWVTGHLPIERADGQPLEARNRVTLCNCGRSKNKPFCDGTHRKA
jgi:CDGSH-type Zn-finger protein